MPLSCRFLQVATQLHKPEEDRLDTFIFGLDDYIKYDVWTQSPADFNEVVRLALLQEMKHNKGKPKGISKDVSDPPSTPFGKGKESCNSPPKSPSSSSSPAEGQTSNPKGKSKASDQPKLTPDQKAEQGIIGGSLSKEEILEYAKEQRCFKCRHKGHMKKDCPKSSMPTSSEPSAPAQVSVVISPLSESVPSPPSVLGIESIVPQTIGESSSVVVVDPQLAPEPQ